MPKLNLERTLGYQVRDSLALLTDLHNAALLVRHQISDCIRLIESEMGADGQNRFSTVSPSAVLAEIYGRFGPMCQTLDKVLKGN